MITLDNFYIVIIIFFLVEAFIIALGIVVVFLKYIVRKK